jgi:3-oxoacyl-[acyl-carrier protein] reductase
MRWTDHAWTEELGVDLGISGRRAIVCASSQGLGLACAVALAQEGVDVAINGRDEERLAAAAKTVKEHAAGGEVRAVQADITTDEGREALLSAWDEPDILITNNRGPKPIYFLDASLADLEQAMLLHYWTPLALVRAVIDGMRARKFGRIVSITSAMVASPHPSQAPSAGARTALWAVMKGLSKTVAIDNVTINQLLPQRIDSPRQIEVARAYMKEANITFEEARRMQAEDMPTGRMGLPSEFAAACAFLCSKHAAYISGTSLRLDGGDYRGLI